MKIFISYSHEDENIAQKIKEYFNSQKDTEVWIDEDDIKIGESIPDKIFEGIKKSDFLIALLSKNSVNSGWFKKEIESKMMEEILKSTVNVIPALIEKQDGTWEIPQILSTKKYADLSTDFNAGLKKIMLSLHKLKGQEPIYFSEAEYYSYLLGFTFSKMVFINNDSTILNGLIDQFNIFSKKIGLDIFFMNEITTALESKNIINERTKIGLEKSEQISYMIKSRHSKESASAFFFGFDLIFVIGLLSLIPKNIKSTEIKNNLNMIYENFIKRMLSNGEIIGLKKQELDKVQSFKKLFINLNEKENFQNNLLELGSKIENMLNQNATKQTATQ